MPGFRELHNHFGIGGNPIGIVFSQRLFDRRAGTGGSGGSPQLDNTIQAEYANRLSLCIDGPDVPFAA